MQTTLSPSAAGVYTPPAGRFDLEVDAKMGISLPARSKDDGGAVGEHTSGLTGMASAMRYRLETERQSPLPEETHDDERNDTSASLGLGSGVVVQDNEELPSRIFADEGDHGDSDDVDFFFGVARGQCRRHNNCLVSRTVEHHERSKARSGTITKWN